jgi:hypothetical protein
MLYRLRFTGYGKPRSGASRRPVRDRWEVLRRGKIGRRSKAPRAAGWGRVERPGKHAIESGLQRCNGGRGGAEGGSAGYVKVEVDARLARAAVCRIGVVVVSLPVREGFLVEDDLRGGSVRTTEPGEGGDGLSEYHR